MSKQYFSNIDEVEKYREERLALNMMDIYASCPMLAGSIIKEKQGFYRSGKSVPLIQEGDIISYEDNGVVVRKAYASAADGCDDVITYDEIIAMDQAVYTEGMIREIIPAVKHTLRKKLFTDKPVVPNMFVRAIASIISTIIEECIGKEHVVDMSRGLEKCLKIKESSEQELRDIALNYIYCEQIKAGKREAITDDYIEEVADRFKVEYRNFIELLVEEVDTATYKSIRNFVFEEPCRRYHFDEDDMFFYIERGLDTRIYAWEKNRFDKVESIEQEIGVKINTSDYPKFSATHDFL